MTLFGEKLILPGIADTRTLAAISVALGEYDHTIISKTTNPASSGGGSFWSGGGVSRTTSIQAQRVLSPGEVANIPAGRGLHLDGLAWELLTLAAAHRDQPWKTLTQAEPKTPTPLLGSAR